VRADKKIGPGRPAFAEGTARTGVFTIRVSDDERAAIVAEAERAGKPITQWAREALLNQCARSAGTPPPSAKPR